MTFVLLSNRIFPGGACFVRMSDLVRLLALVDDGGGDK
jgi:hypothetical protein